MSLSANYDSAINLSTEDTAYIQSGTDDKDKDFRRAMILATLDTNGLAEGIQPGFAKQYIDPMHYLVYIDIDAVLNAAKTAGTAVPPDKVFPTVLRALNWDACGRGRGGIAAAAVRDYVIERKEFDTKRECRVITSLTAAHMDIVKAFVAELGPNKDIFAFWKANAMNVVGLSAAIFLKEGHHWDARNTRPQKALLASLDQLDTFTDEDLRKLFYLSIHPVPLPALMGYVKAADTMPGLTEAVKCRLKGSPAGTAGYAVCASVIPQIKAEPFFEFASDATKNDFRRMESIMSDVKSDPISYHVMATVIGATKAKTIDVAPTHVVALCAAYVKVCVKGSLANAASLNKIVDNNARLVQKYVVALTNYVDRQGDDIAAMISGGESSYDAMDRAKRAKEVEDAETRIAQARARAAAAAQMPSIFND